MLDRDEDMLITGGRHPFFGHYKVRISHEYNLLSVENAEKTVSFPFMICEGRIHDERKGERSGGDLLQQRRKFHGPFLICAYQKHDTDLY